MDGVVTARFNNVAPFLTVVNGVTVDGTRFGPIEAAIDRQQGANAWLTVSLAEGRNREVRRAFAHVGLDWREHVTRAEHLVRPLEVDLLVGDASLARAELGCSPTIRFEELVVMMVDAEVERIEAKR